VGLECGAEKRALEKSRRKDCSEKERDKKEWAEKDRGKEGAFPETAGGDAGIWRGEKELLAWKFLSFSFNDCTILLLLSSQNKVLCMLWPNVLTTLRIVLTPVIGVLLLGEALWWAVVCFGLAALTDFADGFVAARWNARSVLGAALDPLADKILVMVSMFFVAANGTLRSHWMLWACVVIMVREIFVLGLRSIVGSRALPVIAMAKVKTTLQMVTLPLLMLLPLYGPWMWYHGLCSLLLLLSAFLSIKSGWSYGMVVFRLLSGDAVSHTQEPNKSSPHSTVV